MSTFYGMVQGNRSEATRGGSKASGFRASAQSYDGSVITNLRYDDQDQLKIRIDLADDSRSSWADTYFNGTMEELKECFDTYRKMKEEKYELNI